MNRLQDWSDYFLALILAIAVAVMFIPRPWINPTLFQAGLFLLGCAWAVVIVVRPFPLRWSFPVVPLSGAVAWGFLQLSAGWTVDCADTRAAVLMWSGNLVAFFLGMQVRRRFLHSILSFAFAVAIFSVVRYFSGGDPPTLGPFVNRDQYAAFIEMVLPMALVQALGGGSRASGFAAMSAAMYASVIAGASRAGALLVTAEVVVVPFAMWTRSRPSRTGGRSAAIQVGLLVLVFVAVVGWAVLWNRFQDPDPFRGRREILADTVAMIHARPWTGFGLGSFRTAYPAYASLDFGAVVHHAHNDWAEWAADGGVPFALLMLSIAIWSIPRAWRTVWGIGLVAVFVHSMVDFPLQKPVLELWLFALLGALAGSSESPFESLQSHDRKGVAHGPAGHRKVMKIWERLQTWRTHSCVPRPDSSGRSAHRPRKRLRTSAETAD